MEYNIHVFYEVGETLHYGNKEFTVVKYNGLPQYKCSKCAFNTQMTTCCKRYPCNAQDREDKQSVYFERARRKPYFKCSRYLFDEELRRILSYYGYNIMEYPSNDNPFIRIEHYPSTASHICNCSRFEDIDGNFLCETKEEFLSECKRIAINRGFYKGLTNKLYVGDDVKPKMIKTFQELTNPLAKFISEHELDLSCKIILMSHGTEIMKHVIGYEDEIIWRK